MEDNCRRTKGGGSRIVVEGLCSRISWWQEVANRVKSGACHSEGNTIRQLS